MSKKIIITGITGQDGSYMAEYCLNLGLTVYGMVRRTSQIIDKNYRQIKDNPNFHEVRGDINDRTSINELVSDIQPDYFVNFAAQSFVGDSWKIPEDTLLTGSNGVLNCLQAIKNHKKSCRFYNAGSSEQFGNVIYSPQDENHPFRPRSIYGVAKCSASYICKVYRESYKMYAVQGLLFNHESERRGAEFVTRKITKGIARICKALQDGQPFDPIELGNIHAKRDWSHAEDFIDGIWRMLNQEIYRKDLKDVTYKGGSILLPFAIEEKNTELLSEYVKGYVLSSDINHSIKEFIDLSLKHAGLLDFTQWVGQAGKPESEKLILHNHIVEQLGIPSNIVVQINPKFYRPADVEILLGNSKLAREELGWEPKISLDILTKRMIESDLNEAGVSKKTS